MLTPSGAVAAAALAGMVRWSVMATSTNVIALALVQPLHGFTFALLHLACMRLIARSMPALPVAGSCWMKIARRARLAKVNSTAGDRRPAAEPAQLEAWEREFDAAAKRPLRQRFRYAFIHTYKPVLDDARFRAFASTAQYRQWCERELPSWLGYGPSV